MGSCLSKKSTSTSSPGALPSPPDQTKPNTQVGNQKPEEETVKKEIFIIKHRKSHEIDRRSEEEKKEVKKVVEVAENGKNTVSTNVSNGGFDNGNGSGIVTATPVRTSSCTNEEVESILIQCGRLSRSSSTGKAGLLGSGGSSDNNGNGQRGRKYSGSKRSYDFDNEIGDKSCDIDKKKGNGAQRNGCEENVLDGDNDEAEGERIYRHRQRQRQARSSSSPSIGRRRTPSRERDQLQQQRSGSRERGSSGGGRRVSRSPGRRSESPITTSNGNGGAASSSGGANNSNGAPGKMVSVPATVSSFTMEKGQGSGANKESVSVAAIKRIQVKRNVSDVAAASRTVASPRARSPARIRASSENQNPNSNNQQQPLSLSRSNSRKAEQSPFKRNPLSEIDTNALPTEQIPLPANKAVNNKFSSQAQIQNSNVENVSNNKVVKEGADYKINSCKGDEAEGLIPSLTGNAAVNVIALGGESLKPQTITRSRSLRRSRDLDINPEALLNPAQSYTALLLEDIQNFHQKSSTPTISLPACVTKACSILEAVADLNSCTSSNLSCTFSDDRKRNPTTEQFNMKEDNSSMKANLVGKKRPETTDDLFVESEVFVSDDLMQPSCHKYVTVRRRGVDTEEQESSGSNSFVGSQQQWVPSSSWEPNSADSTDCWTSSRSNNREDGPSPVSFQRHDFSELGHDMNEAPKRLGGKKRESDHQQTGIGSGKDGFSRVLQKSPA